MWLEVLCVLAITCGVTGDICGLDDSLYCPYGCCYGDCCSQSVWSTGDVSGLVVGVIFFIIICCLFGCCCYRRRYRPLVVNAGTGTATVTQTVSSISTNVVSRAQPGPSFGWQPGNNHPPPEASSYPPPYPGNNNPPGTYSIGKTLYARPPTQQGAAPYTGQKQQYGFPNPSFDGQHQQYAPQQHGYGNQTASGGLQMPQPYGK